MTAEPTADGRPQEVLGGIRSPGGLGISSSTAGAQHTLHLSGELDVASARELFSSASALVHDSSEIVLDLSALNFIDSTGLEVILRLRDMCRENHCRLLLASPNAQVLRLLEVTSLVAPMRDEGLLAD